MAEEQDNANAPSTTDSEAGPAASAPVQREPASERVPEAPEEAALDPHVPSEPVEALAPKERRQRTRAAKAAKVARRRSQTPEERRQERVAERRRKAVLRRAQRQRARTKARASDSSSQATAPREHQPGKPKTRQGVVTSDRADKTITVRIDAARRHRRYEKIVRTSTTLHVHDEQSEAHIGDTVIVRECRPMSRSKRWRLVEVVERAR